MELFHPTYNWLFRGKNFVGSLKLDMSCCPFSHLFLLHHQSLQQVWREIEEITRPMVKGQAVLQKLGIQKVLRQIISKKIGGQCDFLCVQYTVAGGVFMMLSYGRLSFSCWRFVCMLSGTLFFNVGWRRANLLGSDIYIFPCLHEKNLVV